MSNSARGTGEPLLIGSEASCIIMGQASLLSHCGSSRITRRKERERRRERQREHESERERKEKQRPWKLAGKGGWYMCVSVCVREGGYEGTVLHSSSSGQRQTHDCPSTANTYTHEHTHTNTHKEAKTALTGGLLPKQKTGRVFMPLF